MCRVTVLYRRLLHQSKVDGVIVAITHAFAMLYFGSPLSGAMAVSLSPSIPPPLPVGTSVTWSAEVDGADPGILWYRFRSRRLGQDFHMIRDYGPVNTLEWTASTLDGAYEMEVSVRNLATGELLASTAAYEFDSRIVDGQPVISEIDNPTVLLYSAPECEDGAKIRVQLRSERGIIRYTPYKLCKAGSSMNFHLAGLSPNLAYRVKFIVERGTDMREGPEYAIILSQPPVVVPQQSISNSSVSGPTRDEVLLHGALNSNIYATDLDGNLIWYYQRPLTQFTRPQSGGYFYGILQEPGGDTSGQLMRKIDLAGFTMLETNAARVNEQLARMGKRLIGTFHHEVRPLTDGRIVALASVEQYLTDVQGPGLVDVVGDMILVLDRDLQVIWTWDAFDHLDTSRKAVLDEDCGACPPLFLAGADIPAKDWLHGNSIALTPDGHLLYSSRHQDWLMKIDYNNGVGTGNIIWRLGKDGDFRILSNDPWPWFSHQHDGAYEPGSTTLLTVFDDGNTREAALSTANSRGQVLEIDEEHRTAALRLNADLGVYAFALGSAQKLQNGNYHFCVGWLPNASGSLSIEVDPTGAIVYSMQNPRLEYRSVRMRDMYTPN